MISIWSKESKKIRIGNYLETAWTKRGVRGALLVRSYKSYDFRWCKRNTKVGHISIEGKQFLSVPAFSHVCLMNKSSGDEFARTSWILSSIFLIPLNQYLKITGVGAIRSRDTSFPFSPSAYRMENDLSFDNPNVCPSWCSSEVRKW